MTSSMPKNSLKTVLLWISIIYGGHWLNSLFYSMTQGTSVKYLFMDFANPFILLVLLVGIYIVSNREIQNKIHSTIAIQFFLVPLVFILLEAVHFPDSYTIFTKSKYVFYPKIISNSLSMCFLLAIFELSLEELKSERFFHILIKLISLKAIILMLIAILAINRFLSIEANEFLYNNSQAYESLTIVLFLIFDKRISANLPYKHFFLIMNALPMFIFQCRGAALIFCFLFIIHLLMVAYRKIFIDQKKTIIYMSCIFLFAVSYLSGYNLFSMGYGPIPAKQIYGKTETRKVVNFLTLMLKEFQKNKRIDEIFLIKSSGNSLSDATISTYCRIGSILMAFKHFLNNPIIGVGSYKTYSLKVEGFGIHSLLPLILDSYGLCGFLPFLLFSLNLIKESITATHNYFIVFTYSFYVVLVMTFVNGFVWWYSLIIILLRYSSPTFQSKDSRSKEILTVF